MENQTIWKVINSYFEENPQALVSHHIESYNDFFKEGLSMLLKEKNPLQFNSKYDKNIQDYKYQCNMYFGGKDGKKVYYGKPVIQDKENAHYMYPNEARLRNMTYAMPVHYDVELEFVFLLEKGETLKNVSENMLREMVTEQLGGFSTDNFTADDDFFGEEFDEYMNEKLGDFKLRGGDGEENDGGAVDGGAPPTQRKKKAPMKMQMTTAIADMLRKVDESSVITTTKQVYRTTLEKVFLGKFPIMVQSEFCILNGIPRDIKYNLGECKNDLGGYFIIDGKEKTVIMQEKFGDNMMYIEKRGEDDIYSYQANIRSVSENASKPIRTISVKMVAPNKKYTNNQIVVSIPNVREPVPLYIVFRALGFLSDQEITEMILLDREKYAFLEDLLVPSVHDAGSIMTQQSALLYIAHLTKYHTVTYGLEILNDYFFPHIGENNYVEKAYFLGNIVFQLLCVVAGLEEPTDRDNYKYKRVEVVGSLIYDLFREYYTMQQKAIHLEFERALYMNQNMYEEDLHKLIFDHHREVFRTHKIVDDGFRKAFKGNWGGASHTKRIGVVQDLNRLSFNSMLSHLRKTNLPLDASVKVVGPRVLHSSHWGYIDPIDTPDGGNIGLHKTLAIMTAVSRGASREPILAWLREHASMKRLEECTPLVLSTMTKVMVNGLWAGSVSDPLGTVNKMKLHKRNALLPIHLSVTFDYKRNVVFVYTDAGRLVRPLFYVEHDGKHNVVSYQLSKAVNKKLVDGTATWTQLTTGYNAHKSGVVFQPTVPKIYELHQLYDGVGEKETNPAKYDRFLNEKATLEYIDPNESENTLIVLNETDWHANPRNQKLYTHMELHESLTFGMMCNLIIFPENNPPVRNSFSCGQSKQAVSLYHTNYPLRMDKTAVVLNSGQIPLVKSRYMEYINHEENPYGENAIVAIMCYTGYNVEDAILVNEGAIKRGLFRTTYYTTYEAHEESSKMGNVVMDKHFSNIETLPNVVGLKAGYDYSHLDATGLIVDNTPVDEKTMLIGLTSNSTLHPDTRVDMSVKPKKGQLGVVDKSFMTEGEEGQRIAKVRVRDIRIPTFGDKMASRAGQKGTVGMVIRECDMPFTKDGIRPDLIINPHAIPTRMTIGQLVECITGKACATYGAFGDCTAFNNKGSKVGVFGAMLAEEGYHSSGNEILYNGMTGEQIETEIFIGPTYYMRLKHMVKDKINYRATGPRAALTRQPVSGRANDGGLRIGEMERDVLVSHGITEFLRESMIDRGDKFYMAVCNKTGMMAVYNPSKNLFMSPMADGPLKFNLNGSEPVLDTITKHGRDFSIVCVPYTFKLLLQELQAMNVTMRIITDDNISQLDAMAYSDNIRKLTYDPTMSPDKLVEMVKTTLKSEVKNAETPLPEKTQMPPATAPTTLLQPKTDVASSASLTSEPGTFGYVPPASPDYAPGSPGYQPAETPPGGWPSPASSEGSIPYAPGSPGYQPAETPTTSVLDTISTTIGSLFSASPANTEQRGGTSHYGMGDNVCYVKSGSMGLHPYTPWKVQKVGDQFYTIVTDLGGTDLSQDESVKVVFPNEIYTPPAQSASLPNEYLQQQYMAMQQPQTQVYSAPAPMTMGMGGVAPMKSPENINIKIINNGTDNSVGSNTDETTNNAVSPASASGVTTTATANVPARININPQPVVAQPAHSVRVPASSKNNELDFNNLVIKKIG